MSGRTTDLNSTRGHRRDRHHPFSAYGNTQDQRGVGNRTRESTAGYQDDMENGSSFSNLNVISTRQPSTGDTRTGTSYSARRQGLIDFDDFNPDMIPLPNIRQEIDFNNKDDDGSSCPGSDDDSAGQSTRGGGQSSNSAIEHRRDQRERDIDSQVRLRLRELANFSRDRAANFGVQAGDSGSGSSCPGSEDESPIIPSYHNLPSYHHQGQGVNTRRQQEPSGQSSPRVPHTFRRGLPSSQGSARIDRVEGSDSGVYTEFEE